MQNGISGTWALHLAPAAVHCQDHVGAEGTLEYLAHSKDRLAGCLLMQYTTGISPQQRVARVLQRQEYAAAARQQRGLRHWGAKEEIFFMRDSSVARAIALRWSVCVATTEQLCC